jgi:hypothetical protein
MSSVLSPRNNRLHDFSPSRYIALAQKAQDQALYDRVRAVLTRLFDESPVAGTHVVDICMTESTERKEIIQGVGSTTGYLDHVMGSQSRIVPAHRAAIPVSPLRSFVKLGVHQRLARTRNVKALDFIFQEAWLSSLRDRVMRCQQALGHEPVDGSPGLAQYLRRFIEAYVSAFHGLMIPHKTARDNMRSCLRKDGSPMAKLCVRRFLPRINDGGILGGSR